MRRCAELCSVELVSAMLVQIMDNTCEWALKTLK